MPHPDFTTLSVRAVNLALLNIGIARTVTSLSDQTREALTANLVYTQHFEALLRTHPWPFATKYLELTLHTGTILVPAQPDWRYAYVYPTDCVMARRIVKSATARQFDPTPTPFRVGRELVPTTARVIYTNEDTGVDPAVACLEYTMTFDPPEFYADDLFIDALAWRLAAALAPSLSKLPKMREKAWFMYLHTLASAGVTAMNEQQQELEGDAAWIRDRA